MASQNSIHPTFDNAPTLDHDNFFLPPSEQVNLANLFTNVTITNTNRIHVLSDPLNDPFIPFGWVTKLHVPQQYLQFINIRQLLVGYGVGPSSKPNKHPCENYPRPLRKQFRPTVELNETDESLYKDLEFIPNRYASELQLGSSPNQFFHEHTGTSEQDFQNFNLTQSLSTFHPRPTKPNIFTTRKNHSLLNHGASWVVL